MKLSLVGEMSEAYRNQIKSTHQAVEQAIEARLVDPNNIPNDIFAFTDWDYGVKNYGNSKGFQPSNLPDHVTHNGRPTKKYFGWRVGSSRKTVPLFINGENPRFKEGPVMVKGKRTEFTVAGTYLHELVHALFPGTSGGNAMGVHAKSFYERWSKVSTLIKMPVDATLVYHLVNFGLPVPAAHQYQTLNTENSPSLSGVGSDEERFDTPSQGMGPEIDLSDEFQDIELKDSGLTDEDFWGCEEPWED